MNDDIKLRDRESGDEILGTLEADRHALAFDGVAYDPRGSAALAINLCGPLRPQWAGTETVTDDDGEPLFVRVKGPGYVKGSAVEPFVEGMSDREFGEQEVRLRFLADLDQGALLDLIGEMLDPVLNAGPAELFVVRQTIPEGGYRTVNATTMALAAAYCDRDPAEVGLTYVGRDVVAPTHPEVDTMTIDEDRSHWDEIPGHPHCDWRQEVSDDDTRLGYVEWAQNRIAGARSDGRVFCVYCGNDIIQAEGCDSVFCELRRKNGSLAVCRSCGGEYTEGGDGYDGECPSCADRSAMNEELGVGPEEADET